MDRRREFRKFIHQFREFVRALKGFIIILTGIKRKTVHPFFEHMSDLFSYFLRQYHPRMSMHPVDAGNHPFYFFSPDDRLVVVGKAETIH